jgi:hypothetical protein
MQDLICLFCNATTADFNQRRPSETLSEYESKVTAAFVIQKNIYEHLRKTNMPYFNCESTAGI